MADLAIISRAEWNARPPKNPPVSTTWDRKTEFIVHFSGAARTQSIRSIQDYCMDNRGYNDIDYNFLVKDGLVYEGRGWLVIGSHTLNHNTVGVGVCVVGKDGDATEADRMAVRWLYDQANRLSGRTLAKLGHRDANPGATDCPGNQLEAWVKAGMPVTGVDMEFVKFVQDGLRAAGFDPGPSDGIPGPRTMAALVAAFKGRVPTQVTIDGPIAAHVSAYA